MLRERIVLVDSADAGGRTLSEGPSCSTRASNALIGTYCRPAAVEIQFHIGWSKLAAIKFPSWAEIASCHCQIMRGNCKMSTVQRKLTSR